MPRIPETAIPGGGERVAKVIARAGLCSRREAEQWIEAGRITINGRPLTSPAVNVAAGDVVTVDGSPLPERTRLRLWRYHKPPGLMTTHSDPQGRPTVFERLPEDMGRVISIGRLDLPSEGLLLLTNDGSLARHLELPSTGWRRRYRVRVHGTIEPAAFAGLAAGITIEGIRYGAIEAAVERVQGSNAWLSVALHEGKNREIRKVLQALRLDVGRLIRISYGPFQLGSLVRGGVEEVQGKVLSEQLGKNWR